MPNPYTYGRSLRFLAWLKDRRASQIVEEGLLLGMALFTFAILFSLVLSMFNGLERTFQGIIGGAETSLRGIWDEISKALKIVFGG